MIKALAVIALTISALGCSADKQPPEQELPPIEYDVRIGYGEPAPDLLPPQQLHVLFTEASWGDGWTGDASMMWAYRECEDMGGTMGNSGPAEWTCWDVDY